MDADRTESAMDRLLERAAGIYDDDQDERNMISAARAELRALRERVADLEMIVDWLTEDGRQLRRHETVGGAWCSLDDLREQQVLLCAADAKGLPVLTPEARRALRGPNSP